MTSVLWTGPADTERLLVLAHGAGAAMDSPWMDRVAELLGERGIRVARFEFAYMTARREGRRPPAPAAEKAAAEYREVLALIREQSGLVPTIGGKSYGGRVASLVADELHTAGAIRGLVCLGYPFHPLGKPERVRTEHLADLSTPTLVCQGERDPMGRKEEVAGYALSPAIRLHWAPSGDHDLRPLKASGLTLDDNLAAAADAIVRL